MFTVLLTVVPVTAPVADTMFDVTSPSSGEAVVVELFEPFDDIMDRVSSLVLWHLADGWICPLADYALLLLVDFDSA